MKTLKFFPLVVLALVLASCTDEEVAPKEEEVAVYDIDVVRYNVSSPLYHAGSRYEVTASVWHNKLYAFTMQGHDTPNATYNYNGNAADKVIVYKDSNVDPYYTVNIDIATSNQSAILPIANDVQRFVETKTANTSTGSTKTYSYYEYTGESGTPNFKTEGKLRKQIVMKFEDRDLVGVKTYWAEGDGELELVEEFTDITYYYNAEGNYSSYNVLSQRDFEYPYHTEMLKNNDLFAVYAPQLVSGYNRIRYNEGDSDVDLIRFTWKVDKFLRPVSSTVSVNGGADIPDLLEIKYAQSVVK